MALGITFAPISPTEDSEDSDDDSISVVLGVLGRSKHTRQESTSHKYQSTFEEDFSISLSFGGESDDSVEHRHDKAIHGYHEYLCKRSNIADEVPADETNSVAEIDFDVEGYPSRRVDVHGRKILVLSITLVVVTVTVYLIGTQKGKHARRQSGRSDVIDLVSHVSSTTNLQLTGSAQNKALQWLLSDSYLDAFFLPGSMNAGIIGIGEDELEQIVLERYGLATFYFSTTNILGAGRKNAGEGWKSASNWLSERAVCDWYGVVCDIDQKVKELRLVENEVKGTIPFEIGLLTEIQKIDLGQNMISGSITSGIRNLVKLTDMRLDNNYFSGQLHAEMIGDLTGLEVLSLDDNELEGSIPSSINRLKSLLILSLSGNSLTGAIPKELGGLERLYELDLSKNQLDGTIPNEIGDLRQMQELRLSGNRFIGHIPDTFLGLTELVELRLNGNELTGEIPNGIERIYSLRGLYLDHNRLSGNVPKEIGSLAQLKEMTLENNGLTGSLPPSICALTLHLLSADCTINCPCCTVKCRPA